jgi:nucleoside-diphosphate-sugar epimerase
MTAQGKVTILGINGHIGHHSAVAFAAAGWKVTGFGRSNRTPLSGVKFLAGDADSLADLQKAVEDADVVINALNLPYHQWDKGRMEAQTARVIEAMGTTGKTLMYPGNIYNFAATDRVITPDTIQHPETPRGAIRVRSEALLKAAAERGDIQILIVRAGDFFAAGNKGDYFEQGIMREAKKHKIAYPGPLDIGHSWAYLPDLGRAFEKLAWHRKDLGRNETFHFAGHYVSGNQLMAAIKAAAPVPLTEVSFPWPLFHAVGLFMPLLREVIKMRYLWNNPMQLSDPRLDAILGPDFGTPYQAAIDAVVAPYFAEARMAA